MTRSTSALAINGGPKAIQSDPEDVFRWPQVTEEDEEAVLEVLRRGAMSALDVTTQFEKEFAEWHGAKYALAHNTGTAAIQSAMFGVGVGVGDEVICPSLTFWASCVQAFSLGATIVFADVLDDTICIDPGDVEHRITDRTRAIICVHYVGYPCDMDPIMEIAERHNVKVIEDVSHAHGGLYKGRLVGTIGHVAAMSIMSAKSLAAGEGGMLITNDRLTYERAVAFGHYERHSEELQDPTLKPNGGVPFGGYKYRMHQLTSAMGRVQLRHYRERMEIIQRAMNYFWDLLEGVPGIKAHRPPKHSDSTMGGWYAAHGLYRPEEIGGLSVRRFCEAVTAEGFAASPGANFPLHLHPVLNEVDVYGHGKPTRIANSLRDLRQGPGSLPVTENIPERCFWIPWFKKFDAHIIEEHALAFRKVAEHADELI